jgi:hypothetical protein
MIPILDLSGLISHLIVAVGASTAPDEIKTFVIARLGIVQGRGMPDCFARVKVFDAEVPYGAGATSVDSLQTSIEVAKIPTPL